MQALPTEDVCALRERRDVGGVGGAGEPQGTAVDATAGSLGQVSSGNRPEPEQRRRRPPADAPRRHEVRVRLSPAEADVVGAAAQREGLSVGAWVGQLAVGRAEGQADPVPVTWQNLVAELVRFRADVSRAVDLIQQTTPGTQLTSAVGLAGELLGRVDAATAAALAAGMRGARDRHPDR